MAGMKYSPPSKTRYRVCPFCGKPDYCTVGTYADGAEYLFCRRLTNVNVNVGDTVNGQYAPGSFVYKGVSPQGAYRFETMEQYQKRRDEQRDNPAYKLLYTSDKGNYRPDRNVYSEEVVVARDRFYRQFLSLLVLEPYHFKKLEKEWGSKTKEWTEHYLIRSMPPTDSCRYTMNLRLKNCKRKFMVEDLLPFYPKEGVAGFELHEKYGLNFYASPGIIYPIFNSKNQIVCLRVGVDYPDIKTDDGEYSFNPYKGEWNYKPNDSEEKVLVYSPSSQVFRIKLNDKGLPMVDGKVENKYRYVYSKVSYGSQVGLYLPINGLKNYRVVFGVEGEKKSIVGANTLNYPFVNITGVGNFRRMFQEEDGMKTSLLEYLVEKGCELFVVAYDADKRTNMMVLKQEQGFVTALKERNISPAVAEWNAHWGKGLDDALMMGARPVIYPIQ